MTAPPTTTARTALARADRTWCRDTADEPLDAPRLDHLAAAVQARPDIAAPAVDVDEHQAELNRVRAFEEQRREDLRVELWKHIEVQQRRAERAEQEVQQQRRLAEIPIDGTDLAELRDQNDRLRGECEDLATRLREVANERDQARRELDRWALALVDANQQLAEARHDTDTWQGEYERVVDDKLVDLADALEERDTVHAELDQLTARLNEAADHITELQREVAQTIARARHRHAWEVQPGLKDMSLPCSCGQPWPRNRPPGDGAMTRTERVELLNHTPAAAEGVHNGLLPTPTDRQANRGHNQRD